MGRHSSNRDHSERVSYGIVPVTKVEGNWKFLLLRSFAYWDFPKGQPEANETPWQTALREAQEETGLETFFPYDEEKFYATEAYAKGKIAKYFLAEVSNPDEVVLKVNPVTGIFEHHEFRWVTSEEAEKLINPRIKKVLHWALKRLEEFS